MKLNRGKLFTAVVHTAIFVIGAFAGWYMHAWYYDDIRLDLGGGGAS